MRFNPLLILSFLFLCGFANAQQAPLSGKVVDEITNEPIPYATVLLKSKGSNTILSGTSTDDQGNFSLKSSQDSSYLEIKFMGYKTLIISDSLWKSKGTELGTIELQTNEQALGTVEVRGEQSTMEFKLDKRVFNVGEDLSSSGAGALEVLNNVPSVSVDIEGNVYLRGSAGVQILINGKPAVSDDPSNVLAGITADQIERVEIITNPSAKYNAEGTSGIINIVLKKEENKGVNGSISVNTGYPHNHSVGGSVNLRTEKFNFFTQFGAGYRSLPNYNENRNVNFQTGTTVQSDGINYRNENFYNITLGTDYHINDYNVLTLSGNFAYEIESQPSTTEFTITDSTNEILSQYRRIESTSAFNPKYQYDLNYTKKFKNDEDHILLIGTQGRFFGKDQASSFENESILGTENYPSQRINTDFYQADYTFKIDYANPLSEKFSIETGALYEINDVGNNYSVANLQNNNWLIDSSLTNNFQYVQKVLGIYGTGAFETKKWGIKIGARLENTDLQTLLITTGEENKRNFTNLFPSVHTSYKISRTFSFQLGYSRRIFRPRLWDLNPFFNIRNLYNVRTGNPDLMPEFADSYELTAIWISKKASLNGSVYHLYTTDVIERVSYFEDNVNITTPINVGVRNKTGVELNGKWNIAKWFILTGDFNYGYFTREGQFESQDFNFEGNQWRGRLTSKLDLKKDFDIEISGNYESSYRTVQGEVSGFFYADMGLRKKLWKGKGVINFAIRDIFASRIRESLIQQPSFSSYDFSMRGRFMTLGFSYSFGKGEAISYTGRRH